MLTQDLSPEEWAAILLAGVQREGLRWTTLSDLFRLAMEQAARTGVDHMGLKTINDKATSWGREVAKFMATTAASIKDSDALLWALDGYVQKISRENPNMSNSLILATAWKLFLEDLSRFSFNIEATKK